MPALSVLSGNQLQAVSGRTSRPVLGDVLQAARPSLFRDRAFQQQQREFELETEGQAIQRTAQARQAQAQQDALAAQKSQQRQQVIGTAISGVGSGALLTETVAPGTLKGLATSAGILSPAAAPVATTGTLTAAEAAGPVAEFGLTAGGAGGAAGGAGGASTGALAGLAGPAVAAGGGLVAGSLVGPPVRKLAGGGVKGGFAGAGAGAAAGAGTGALVGTFVFPGLGTAAGAVLGGVAGALTGGLCVIVSAAHGRDSDQVRVARAFRDRHMTRNQLKGYYAFSETVVPRMEADAAYKAEVTHTLVDPLVRYGRFLMHAAPRPSKHDIEVTLGFLDFLEQTGKTMPVYKRSNGEIIV